MSDNNNKLEWFIKRASVALRQISLSLAAQEAMEFIDCVRKGGSYEECYEIHKTLPIPSPGCPFFRDLLNKLTELERKQALSRIKHALENRILEIDRELKIG